jgi:Holliday junction resolvasome RuvABC ATP-dependent DNA helicase subunit
MLTLDSYTLRNIEMSLETFFLLVCTFSFLVVSVALAGKFAVSAYLEYIQVKEGIRVMTLNDQKELMKEILEDEDDL